MKKIQLILLTALFSAPFLSHAEEYGQEALEDSGEVVIAVNYIGVKEYGNMFGISAFYLPEGFGFYGSVKTSGSSNYLGDSYFDTIDVKDTVDPVTSRFKVADFITLGATWSAPQHFSAYLGAGYAENKGYAELYGPIAKPGQPTFNQSYYVNDEANTSSEFYLDGGIVLSYEAVSIHIGRNSLTQSTEFGVGFSLGL